MRAAIYNPYLDSLGGGERYTLAVAQTLVGRGYSVDVQWEKEDIKEKLEKRLGIDLSGINFIPDIKRGDSYDVCFWVSDGSIPTLRARKNILHFQIPFHGVNGITLLNRMKLFRINKIVCNSFFTKSFIDKEYGVNSLVVYPPVPVEKIKPREKENVIFSLGRFSQIERSKRQDVLVRAFKKFYDDGGSYDEEGRGVDSKKWNLVLAGGADVGAEAYVNKLKKDSVGYPIKILAGRPFSEIRDIFGSAKIYWSAAGFDIDERKQPEAVEHFGISVVEAMAAGCVPVVFEAGGHREIIRENENGFLWQTIPDLLRKTETVMEDARLVKSISAMARQDAQRYGYGRFAKEFADLL